MVTVKEARKLLPNKYEQSSDEEIQKIIDSLNPLADIIVDITWKKLIVKEKS